MPRKLFYGWIIAGTIFTAWSLSIGPRQSFSIFLLPLVEDFGSSRSAVSAVFSVQMASYALGGWLLGMVLDRVGPKRIIAWSTAAWALVLIASASLTSLWQLYLVWGVLGGAATGGLAYVANNALIARWFVRYRGLASGIAQSAVPMGAALYAPLSQYCLARLGWRGTCLVFGAGVAATALPLVLLVHRNDPAEMGLAPDGAPRAVAPRPAPAPAARKPGHHGAGFPPGYWPVFLANILRGITMYALQVHQVAYLVDAGFTRMAAASTFGLVALLGIPGGLAAGGLSDRLGRTRTYTGTALLYAAGYLALLLVRGPDQPVRLALFILAAGLAYGAASSVFAALLTDRLQGPRLGFLLGLQNIGFGLGGALAPYLAGAAFDLQGSYTLAFLLVAGCAVASAAILALARGR